MHIWCIICPKLHSFCYCCCRHWFEFCHYEKILELWFVIQGTVLDLKLLQHDLWILQRTSKGHELFHANLERYSLSSEVILFLLLQNKVYFVVLVCIFDFKTKSRELGNLYIFFYYLSFYCSWLWIGCQGTRYTLVQVTREICHRTAVARIRSWMGWPSLCCQSFCRSFSGEFICYLLLHLHSVWSIDVFTIVPI